MKDQIKFNSLGYEKADALAKMGADPDSAKSRVVGERPSIGAFKSDT